MTRKKASNINDVQFYTSVDDELFDELHPLAGSKVVFAAVWEDSLADALENDQQDGIQAADIDLYLDQGIFFECFGVVCYPDLDGEPLSKLSAIDTQLVQAIGSGLWLEEIAVDEDEALVLVLARNHRPILYLQIGAWLLEEWDELPNSPTS